MNQPQDALDAFDQAERASPYRNDTTDLGKHFSAQIAQDRSRAYRALKNLPLAVAQQEFAVRLTPEDPTAWRTLAELYDADGNWAGAENARQEATALQSPNASLK
jgi:tetratricopeptide (TPR) repeat protein